MINSTEKEVIKKVLGHRYGKLVQEYLTSKNILNRNGKPFSLAQINNVMNGVNHATIEPAILDLTALKKKEQDKRKAILETI